MRLYGPVQICMRCSVNVNTPESVPTALARLNAVIDDVAKQPGWNYEKVADEAGFHVMTLHALRKGRTKNPDERTLRGLDIVLGFEPGKGVQRILDGKRPVKAKAKTPVQEDETAKRIRRIREMEHLNEFQKQAFIDMIVGVLDQAEEMDAKLAQQDSDTA